jgi:hypothetical protein
MSTSRRGNRFTTRDKQTSHRLACLLACLLAWPLDYPAAFPKLHETAALLIAALPH